MAEEKIHAAISAIMCEMGAIGKNKENTQGFRFKYRGIDDVYNELHELLAKHGVYTVPEVLPETMVATEATSAKGGVIFNKACVIRYHFIASDGSRITATVIGSAMDSGDKAWNKAMSVAHKYAFFQVFAIATDDIADPDATSHEVVGTQDVPPDVVTKHTATPEQNMKTGRAKIITLIEDNRDLLDAAYITGVELDAEKAKTTQDVLSVWKDLDSTVKHYRAKETKAAGEDLQKTVSAEDVEAHKKKLMDESLVKIGVKADEKAAEEATEESDESKAVELF